MSESDPQLACSFDLKALPDSFYDDPYPTYRALREHAPVKWLADNAVFLSRYADAVEVYRNTETFSSDKKREFGPKFGERSRLFRHHTTSLVFNDAPYHTRVRRTIMGALVPRALSRLEGKIEALVDRLLDRAEDCGRIDAIADFAAAIPVEVIGDLLCIPDQDRGPLRGWSLAILGALEPAPSEKLLANGEQALQEFHAYLGELVRQRYASPNDRAYDVLTRLIESDSAPLSEVELAENCVFLLNAGHETTTNLIGNALELFARFRDQRARLAADPDLFNHALEEVLRYESSNQLGNRIATKDAQIGGTSIGAGCFVTLAIGAANRDPQEFPSPDSFDIGRHPNRHLAFGAGPHQCAGMNVARLEARIALGRFLSRFPDFVLDGQPVRNRRARFRGFSSLPVALG